MNEIDTLAWPPRDHLLRGVRTLVAAMLGLVPAASAPAQVPPAFLGSWKVTWQGP